MERKSSLRHKLIFLSVGVLALYYALVSLFSLLFMEPYYLHRVEQTLVNAFYTLEAQETFDIATVSKLEESNLSIVIADIDTMEILYNSQMPDRFVPDMLRRLLPGIRDHILATGTNYTINADEDYRHTASGVVVSGGRRVTLGGLTDQYIIDISTSYASISQATSTSLTFSLGVGLLVMVVAGFAFSRMSSMVIQPVTQITEIANQIAHLDFSQKCQVHDKGEIGLMAQSINTMSDFMQSHISQLEKANEQLTRDIAAKKEQEEARKNLVSNLSHDLKTPIGLISGYADGLRSGMAKTEEEMKEYCDVICDESDRMMSMIVRMMELFRLESGTVELQNEEFDLADLLNYVVEIFSIEIERKKLSFTASYGEGLYICADYFSVEQVVTNYVQNAVSHMGNGNVLHIGVEDREDCYRVVVFNSAEPIPEQELGRIWDSFYRLDKSRTSRLRSGLGLSIVRSNMELLGGGYGAENAEGGVRFWAEFPKAYPAENEMK